MCVDCRGGLLEIIERVIVTPKLSSVSHFIHTADLSGS